MDYAREDDDVYFWRLDRIGRSVIDVLNTVNELTAKGIRLHSIMDQLDPETTQGKLQLTMMAALDGVISAQKRGVRFGPAPLDEAIAPERVAHARRMMAEGKSAALTAKTLGWSKATLYRYLNKYGEGAPEPEGPVRAGEDGSKYAARRRTPAPRK